MGGREVPLIYVGDIILGDIEYTEHGVNIPVQFENSQLNKTPALIFKDIKTEINGKYIYISVRVWPKGKDKTPAEPLITIKEIDPGSYYVYYRNPNDVIQSVKPITIKAAANEDASK